MELDDAYFARITAATRTDPHCIALYDFDGQSPDEISFTAGTAISLIDRVDSDWLRGSIDSQEGILPSSFVEIVIDIPDGELFTTLQSLGAISSRLQHQIQYFAWSGNNKETCAIFLDS